MFYFVELMRAKRGMRVMGIILGIVLLIAIIFRVTLIGHHVPSDIVKSIESSPTAHLNNHTLADGTLETVVDDPQRQTHAVVDRKGAHLHIVISEPWAEYHIQTQHMIEMGSERENVNVTRSIAHATIDFTEDATFDVTIIFIISAVFALVMATMLAAPLAKENDGHLELTWTKPVSREAYALASAGIDIAAIVLSQILGVITILVASLLFLIPHLILSSFADIGLAIMAPIAWYALLTTMGASVKRGPGLVIGLGWIGAVIVGSVARATAGVDGFIWQMVHAVFQGLAYLDPLSYISYGDHSWQPNGVVTTIPQAVGVLFLLAVLYIATAVLQWRRVEA